MQPIAAIQLDSRSGFEDIIPNNSISLKAKIIVEGGGFLYVSPEDSLNPPLIYIRSIPASRVQAIQYVAKITLP